jgi:hypothetical protein
MANLTGTLFTDLNGNDSIDIGESLTPPLALPDNSAILGQYISCNDYR